MPGSWREEKATRLKVQERRAEGGMDNGGGGGGVFGVSKGKTQPTGRYSVMAASPSSFFWMHWKAAAD